MPSCWMAKGVNSQTTRTTNAFLRNQKFLAHKITNTKNGTPKTIVIANSLFGNDRSLRKCAARVETATKIINHHTGREKIANLSSRFGIPFGVFDWISNDFIFSVGLLSKNLSFPCVTEEHTSIVSVKWRSDIVFL